MDGLPRALSHRWQALHFWPLRYVICCGLSPQIVLFLLQLQQQRLSSLQRAFCCMCARGQHCFAAACRASAAMGCFHQPTSWCTCACLLVFLASTSKAAHPTLARSGYVPHIDRSIELCRRRLRPHGIRIPMPTNAWPADYVGTSIIADNIVLSMLSSLS